MSSVVPYTGGERRVIVYDTYAKDRSIHFDVMLAHDPARAAESESDLNRRALAAARAYLEAMSLDPTWVTLSGCSRCHVDDVSRYADKLWHLPEHDAWIWPIDNCPKPGA
jgi:thiamine monophosphate kinase